MINSKLETQTARYLIERAFRVNYVQPFTLASGRTSPYYIDCKLFLASSIFRDYLTQCFRQRYEHLLHNVTAVGGLELGAYPVAIAMSDVSFLNPYLPDIQAFVIRKQAKGHGIQGRFAGIDLIIPKQTPEAFTMGHTDVLVVEDVTTTGQSMLEAIQVCRQAGLRVQTVITVVDREEADIQALAQEHGFEFLSLFTLQDLLMLHAQERV